MNRRQFGLALAASLALSALTPFTSFAQDKFTVAYSNLADSDAWLKTLRDDFEENAAADGNMDVQFADANGDISKQLDQIDNFIAQKVNGMLFRSPP